MLTFAAPDALSQNTDLLCLQGCKSSPPLQKRITLTFNKLECIILSVALSLKETLTEIHLGTKAIGRLSETLGKRPDPECFNSLLLDDI